MKIRMLQTVIPEFWFLMPLPTPILEVGKIYDAVTNAHAAVTVICRDGIRIGVKPGEFEVVEGGEAGE